MVINWFAEITANGPAIKGGYVAERMKAGE
jgi:hypothetical protein